MKRIIAPLLCILFLTSSLVVSVPVRLKDVSKIIEARDNELLGFGLVVGLIALLLYLY